MSTEEVETSPPLTIAALCSGYHPRFHAQHIVDRFLMGYEIDGRMHHPLPVVSSYVEMEMEGEASVPGQHQRASLVGLIGPGGVQQAMLLHATERSASACV